MLLGSAPGEGPVLKPRSGWVPLYILDRDRDRDLNFGDRGHTLLGRPFLVSGEAKHLNA